MSEQHTLTFRSSPDSLTVSLAPNALTDLRTDLVARRGHASGLLLGSPVLDTTLNQAIDNCIALGGSAATVAELLDSVRGLGEVIKTWREMPGMPAFLGLYLDFAPASAESYCRDLLPELKEYLSGPRCLFLIVSSAPKSAALDVLVFSDGVANPTRATASIDLPEQSPVTEPQHLSADHEPRSESERKVAPPAAAVSPSSGVAAAPAPSAPSEPAPAPLTAVAAERGPAEVVKKTWKPGFWTGMAAALLLLFLGAAAAWWLVPRLQSLTATQTPAPRPVEPGLNLQASRRGADLEVTWDRTARLVQSAQRGFLFVDDGPHRTQLFLEESQLKTGRVVYSPLSQDITIRLEVVTPEDRIFRESLRVVRATPSQPGEANAVETRNRQVRPIAVPPQLSPASPAPDVARNTFVPPPPRSARPSLPAGTAKFESPMELDSGPLPLAQMGTRDPALSNPVRLAPPAPQEPAPSVPPSSAAPNPIAPKQAITPQDRVAPVPVRQVQVAVPAQLRPLLTREVLVSVVLQIDENGKVTQASVKRPSSALENQLSAVAIDAARRWRFEPATRRGRSVPGEYTVIYRFRRNM